MKRNGDQVELTTREASGGTKPRIVRYVLAISLALTVILLTVIVLTGVFSVPG